MKILSFVVILLFSAFTFAQKPEIYACSKDDKMKVIDYFSNLQSENSFIFECIRNQNKKESNIKPLIKISHYNSPIISLPKPFYPEIAERNRMFGSVKVEIIFDESGEVIYAKAVSGKMIFYRNAQQAACASKFKPVQYCEKRVKQRGYIFYNFML